MDVGCTNNRKDMETKQITRWKDSCNTDMEQVVKGGVGKEMYKTKRS